MSDSIELDRITILARNRTSELCETGRTKHFTLHQSLL